MLLAPPLEPLVFVAPPAPPAVLVFVLPETVALLGPCEVLEPSPVVEPGEVDDALIVPEAPPAPVVLLTPLLAADAFPVVPTLDVAGVVVPVGPATGPAGPAVAGPASPTASVPGSV